MKVLLAKSAGFCYGVERAVKLARDTAAERGGCWMLGDIIHNSHVVEELDHMGVRRTDDPAALQAGGHRADPFPWGAAIGVGRAGGEGSRPVSTPPVPMSCASSVWWLRLKRRAAGRSSSASPITRRSWAWPAGAAGRWFLTDRRWPRPGPWRSLLTGRFL